MPDKRPDKTENNLQFAPWRQKMHEIIFEADTFWGKTFDVALLVAILASVVVVMLESVASIQANYGTLLFVLEAIFTAFFTIEYIARILCVGKPLKYVFSFFGIIDLLSIIPFYVSLIGLGVQSVNVIRALRLLRIFRILKLAHLLREARSLSSALIASRAKIIVFLSTVLTLVMILGTIMYLIEGGEENTGFTSIPTSIYWAIVTLTTVGYGDIAPQTVLGQTVASMVMILGYAVIAVPTGIVSAELVRTKKPEEITTLSCPECSREGHDSDAEHCKFCGATL